MFSLLRRKRWLSRGIPLGLAVLVAAALPAAVLQGTWADRVPRDPAGVAEGLVLQLVEDGEGKVARCAIRLPHPAEQVWAAVTDYENYGDVCPYLHARRITYDPSGPTRLDTAAVLGPLEFPFLAEMRFEQNLDEYTSGWHEPPRGDVLVNRGLWVLRPTGPAETLVSLGMDVQVRGVPAFLTRLRSLHQVREVVRRLERRLREGSQGMKW